VKELYTLIVLGFYLSLCPTSLNCLFNLEGDWDRSILLEDEGLNIHKYHELAESSRQLNANTVEQLLVLQPRNRMDLVTMTFQHLKYVHNTGKQRIK
jgi:hypothetical protein